MSDKAYKSIDGRETLIMEWRHGVAPMSNAVLVGTRHDEKNPFILEFPKFNLSLRMIWRRDGMSTANGLAWVCMNRRSTAWFHVLRFWIYDTLRNNYKDFMVLLSMLGVLYYQPGCWPSWRDFILWRNVGGTPEERGKRRQEKMKKDIEKWNQENRGGIR